MNSRSLSYSAQPPPPRRQERAISRRVSAISTVEAEQNAASTGNAPNQLTEEIDEIKRYEDFTTIDWVQDSAREQLRRRARRKENAGFFQRDGQLGWRRKLRESYDAGQAWIVVTLVGTAIGLNAGFLNIVTEWLSDIKRGYCTTAFYLNEAFCCWGAENGM
jgi:chloride channel 3/4/5